MKRNANQVTGLAALLMMIDGPGRAGTGSSDDGPGWAGLLGQGKRAGPGRARLHGQGKRAGLGLKIEARAGPGSVPG